MTASPQRTQASGRDHDDGCQAAWFRRRARRHRNRPLPDTLRRHVAAAGCLTVNMLRRGPRAPLALDVEAGGAVVMEAGVPTQLLNGTQADVTVLMQFCPAS